MRDTVMPHHMLPCLLMNTAYRVPVERTIYQDLSQTLSVPETHQVLKITLSLSDTHNEHIELSFLLVLPGKTLPGLNNSLKSRDVGASARTRVN
jgi:hypothetical protein